MPEPLPRRQNLRARNGALPWRKFALDEAVLRAVRLFLQRENAHTLDAGAGCRIHDGNDVLLQCIGIG